MALCVHGPGFLEDSSVSPSRSRCGTIVLQPALFTRMSIRLTFRSSRLQGVAPRRPGIRRPGWRMPARRVSGRSRQRPPPLDPPGVIDKQICTLCANLKEIARPIPVPPPVINAALCLSRTFARLPCFGMTYRAPPQIPSAALHQGRIGMSEDEAFLRDASQSITAPCSRSRLSASRAIGTPSTSSREAPCGSSVKTTRNPAPPHP